MNFDELQVIWNRQQDEPLFAIDRQAMDSLVRSRSIRMERYMECFEWAFMAAAFSTSIILPLDAWREGDGVHQYIVALICLGAGVAMCSARKRRKQSELAFDESVIAVAQRSLVRVEQHIRSLRLLFWCFHLPIAVCAGVGLTVYSNTRIPLIWLGVILVTGLSFLGTVYDIRKKLIPQRREIQALLNKLTEAGEVASPLKS